MSALTTTCPPWCGKTEPGHDTHTRHLPRTGEVGVSLILDGTWDRPRLLIGHYRTFEDSSSVLLPWREAGDMAKLMAALGHEDIAARITEAAGLHTPEDR
jgi:hypothetical protein